MKHFENYGEFRVALDLARKFYAEAKQDRADDVAVDAANGHRPNYCIHGTNQWTDYDNICGGCEEGVTLLNMSVMRAESYVLEARRRMDLAVSLMGLQSSDLAAMGIVLNSERVVDWAMRPMHGNM